jgi:hypothetical protein
MAVEEHDPGPATGDGAPGGDVDDERPRDPQDPLERARRAAQADEPEGWVEVADSVMSRVRDAVVPAEPVLAVSPSGDVAHDDAGSTVHVSSRVLRAALRRLLRAPTHAPAKIDLTVTDGRLTAVRLELVCSYGPDLLALGDAVRAQVHAELVTLLGPDPAFPPAAITVEVVDVVLGDPHLV